MLAPCNSVFVKCSRCSDVLLTGKHQCPLTNLRISTPTGSNNVLIWCSHFMLLTNANDRSNGCSGCGVSQHVTKLSKWFHANKQARLVPNDWNVGRRLPFQKSSQTHYVESTMLCKSNQLQKGLVLTRPFHIAWPTVKQSTADLHTD